MIIFCIPKKSLDESNEAWAVSAKKKRNTKTKITTEPVSDTL